MNFERIQFCVYSISKIVELQERYQVIIKKTNYIQQRSQAIIRKLDTKIY